MTTTPDLSKDTLCVYCQRELTSPKRLRTHIAKVHPGTYADAAYNGDGA